VTFVDIDAFGRQAEVIAQFMRKGRPLLVEGRLKLDQWEDKNTHQKQSKLRVVLEGFTFLDSKGPDAGGGEAPRRPAPQQAAAQPEQQAGTPTESVPPPEEDDVPF
jgi:single-strand DNA-binding protein